MFFRPALVSVRGPDRGCCPVEPAALIEPLALRQGGDPPLRELPGRARCALRAASLYRAGWLTARDAPFPLDPMTRGPRDRLAALVVRHTRCAAARTPEGRGPAPEPPGAAVQISARTLTWSTVLERAASIPGGVPPSRRHASMEVSVGRQTPSHSRHRSWRSQSAGSPPPSRHSRRADPMITPSVTPWSASTCSRRRMPNPASRGAEPSLRAASRRVLRACGRPASPPVTPLTVTA